VVRLQRTPAQISFPLEDKGASTEAVLSEIGLGPAEIASLREHHVI